MPRNLESTSLAKLGFYGLNTQRAAPETDIGFALKAENCIIDQFGRLGARKGWDYVTSSGGTSTNITGMHQFTDVAGLDTLLSWNGTNIYKGSTTMSQLTPTTGVSTGDWDVVTLNDRAYFFQENVDPLYYETSPSETLDKITAHGSYVATVPKAGIALSAYGRLWVAGTGSNKTTVYFSDLLDGLNWGTGTAGSIDISSVFTQGMDEIVGLGAHNGMLIIFCKNSIVIYSDTNNYASSISVSSLTLVEVIEGIGCISKKSIKNTGEDIIFLSNTGVRSLGRTIQEKSQPVRDLSKNVHDDIIKLMRDEDTPTDIRAVYSPVEAFYLIYFPEAQITYCFDMRSPLPDGSARVTTWKGMNHGAYLYLQDSKELYFGQTDGIATYTGYTDNDVTYSMVYYTTYIDFDMPTREKILKKAGITLIGTTGQKLILKIGVDYSSIYTSYPYILENGKPYYYNVHEYELTGMGGTDHEDQVARYSGGIIIDNIISSVGGYGFVFQLGFESVISGSHLSLQTMDLFMKLGRLS